MINNKLVASAAFKKQNNTIKSIPQSTNDDAHDNVDDDYRVCHIHTVLCSVLRCVIIATN
jgi:hypothetical protein